MKDRAVLRSKRYREARQLETLARAVNRKEPEIPRPEGAIFAFGTLGAVFAAEEPEPEDVWINRRRDASGFVMRIVLHVTPTRVRVRSLVRQKERVHWMTWNQWRHWTRSASLAWRGPSMAPRGATPFVATLFGAAPLAMGED